MKIAIDTNNLAALERQAAELDLALGTVRHAIQELKQRASTQSRAHRPLVSASEISQGNRVPKKAAQVFAAVLATMPGEFTTRELREAIERDHPHTGRLGIMAALGDAVRTGRLDQIQPAAGRRPAKYKKANRA